MFLRHVSDEVDLTPDVKLLEHRSECVNSWPSLHACNVRRNGQVRYPRRGIRSLRRGSPCDPVDQVENTAGENQDEWTEEQTNVQMKIPRNEIKPSHLKAATLLDVVRDGSTYVNDESSSSRRFL